MKSSQASTIEICLKLFPESEHHLRMIERLHQQGEDVFSRSCFGGHFTASACVVSEGSILMIDSEKFDCWLLPGGHIDPDECPLATSRREMMEECGIADASLLTPASSDQPAGLDVHWIEANPKRQEPRHLHYDLQYIWSCRKKDLNFLVDKREVRRVDWTTAESFGNKYRGLKRSLAALGTLR